MTQLSLGKGQGWTLEREASNCPGAFGHSALGGNNLMLVHIEEGAWSLGHCVGASRTVGEARA